VQSTAYLHGNRRIFRPVNFSIRRAMATARAAKAPIRRSSNAQLSFARYQRHWVVEYGPVQMLRHAGTMTLILRQFRRKVTDGSVLGLLEQFLNSGVMVGTSYEPRERGSPARRRHQVH